MRLLRQFRRWRSLSRAGHERAEGEHKGHSQQTEANLDVHASYGAGGIPLTACKTTTKTSAQPCELAHWTCELRDSAQNRRNPFLPPQDWEEGISSRPPSDVRNPHTAAAATNATNTHELCPYQAVKSVVNNVFNGVSMRNTRHMVANKPKRSITTTSVVQIASRNRGVYQGPCPAQR